MFNNLYPSTKIFIIDTIEFIVIGEVNSVRIGNAIVNGILHTSMMVVDIESSYDDKKDYILTKKPQIPPRDGYANDALTDKNLIGTLKQNDLIEIETISDRILKIKEIFTSRKFGLEYLDKWCLRYLSKSSIYRNDGIVLQYIKNELEKSNPELEVFSDGILTYSDIMQTTPLDAYRQLRLDYDSISIWLFKISAIWSKYSYRINQLTSIPEMIQLLDLNLHAEIYGNDRL